MGLIQTLQLLLQMHGFLLQLDGVKRFEPLTGATVTPLVMFAMNHAGAYPNLWSLAIAVEVRSVFYDFLTNVGHIPVPTR